MKNLFRLLIILFFTTIFLLPLYAETGQADKIPWSGWWWPFKETNNTDEPNLYDANGPLEKYDLFANQLGTDSAKQWEGTYHIYVGSENWHGHCNAWSAASLLEPEPRYGIDIGGIVLKVGDLKGLLTETYFIPLSYVGKSYWGDYYGDGKDSEDINDIYPGVLLGKVLPQIKGKNLAFINDITFDKPVRNYPVYHYGLTYQDLNDGNNTFAGTLILSYVDDAVSPNFVGSKTFDKTYTFNIRLVDGQPPEGEEGTWTGVSLTDHPDFAWWPEGRMTYQDAKAKGSREEDCPNPHVDYAKVKQLISAPTYTKQIAISKDGTTIYQAHWLWNADLQKRQLTIDESKGSGSGKFTFEIVFGKSMNKQSGFKVELLPSDSSISYEVKDSVSWAKEVFEDDKWQGSITISSTNSDLMNKNIQVKISGQGADGKSLNSQPEFLSGSPGSDTTHYFTTDILPPTLDLKDSSGSNIGDGGLTNKTAISVTVNDSLNGSGIDRLEVRKDNPNTGTVIFSDDTDTGQSYTYSISGLTEGKIYVKALDKAGNTISRQFLLDTTPPVVSYINASLGPGTKAQTVTITATATDGLTVINGGEFYINQGQPITMWAKDGDFDELTDIVEGKASVSHLADGETYTVSVRAKDKAGNWSTYKQSQFKVYRDTDGDGEGDLEDKDDDNDTVLDEEDNAPFDYNLDQTDTDKDGIGDVVDPDDDNDTVLDEQDNAPKNYNPKQEDSDDDGIGDAGELDKAKEGVKGKAGTEDSFPTTISTAKDPNELLVSPEGDIRPGDRLNYTINYENEGEGIAFGVYITCTLEEDLGDSTLSINNNGVYDPETRTITWFIGELASKQKGSVSFSINAKQDLTEGAEVINFATVYFPSVPEATRTNGTVNRITTATDTTPPTTQAAISPQPNQSGWNNTDVTITLTAQDNEGGSGVAKTEYSLDNTSWTTYSSPFVISTEGTTTVYYKSTDNLDNVESSKSIEVKIDKTPPTIVAQALPQPNSNGWNNTDVTVTFTATDALSGVSAFTQPQIITAEGSSQITGGQATDLADNSVSTSVTINIDKTQPEVVIATPAEAVEYFLNQSILADWSATDSLSGIASSTGTVPSGSSLDTSTVGTKSFNATVLDNAGNKTEKTATYFVRYNYSGILPPINPDGSNLFKLGRTIPVKFQLKDSSGSFVSTAVAKLYLVKISDNVTGTEIEAESVGEANTGNLFRYDATSQQYIFNLGTSILSEGTWQIRIALDDGTSKYVNIALRK